MIPHHRLAIGKTLVVTLVTFSALAKSAGRWASLCAASAWADFSSTTIGEGGDTTAIENLLKDWL